MRDAREETVRAPAGWAESYCASPVAVCVHVRWVVVGGRRLPQELMVLDRRSSGGLPPALGLAWVILQQVGVLWTHWTCRLLRD